MKTFKLTFLVVIVILSLMGCATASVITNKSEELSGPYKKFFILLNSSSRSQKFTEGLIKNIKKEFAARNIELEICEKKDLVFQTGKDLNDKINDSKADVVMIIKQTAGWYYGGIGARSAQGSNSGTFEVRLYDKSSENSVWMAQLKATGDYGISMAIHKATKKLMTRFEQDSIISRKL